MSFNTHDTFNKPAEKDTDDIPCVRRSVEGRLCRRGRLRYRSAAVAERSSREVSSLKRA